jgi:hypothetical protein
MKKTNSKPVSILLLLPACLLLAAKPASAQETGLLRVYLAGESSTVYPALNWAGWMTFVIVEEGQEADVLLLNGVIPDPDLVRVRLAEGAGLVLILGPDVSSETFTRATNVPVTMEPADNPVRAREAAVSGEPVLTQVEWDSAPPLRERSRVMTPVSSVQPLVSSAEDGDWLIWSLPGGTAFIVDFHLGKGDNAEFRKWNQYNYLIYQLVARAGGQAPLDFAEYPGAVLPGASGNGPLLFALGLLGAVGLAVLIVIFRLRSTPPETPPAGPDRKTDPDARDEGD